jgi:hypothetical protein
MEVAPERARRHRLQQEEERAWAARSGVVVVRSAAGRPEHNS